MLIATDYRGIELVKCSNCGKIYPVDEHSCPECGSSIASLILKDEDNEKSKSY